MSSIGVVGGGILGMTLAKRFRAAGHDVTVLEGGPRLGGLASPARHGEYTWDRFYHVTLLSDLHLRALLEELELADQLRWGQTRTGFYTDGRLYSLSNNLEFLRFPPLSLLDKVRLGATIFHASRVRDGRKLEARSVSEWLTAWSGRRVFERIWLPLLKSKLGDNYRIASAAFIWAIIARMYAARRSGLKREMFGYVDGGYARVLGRFQEHLDALGVVTRCQAPVDTVEQGDSGPAVILRSGERLPFDRVVLTIPCGRVAQLCPQLTEAERDRLMRVVYQGIACPSLLLKRPLADFYVTNITESWVPFTGVIEMTALVDRDRFGGHSLVYLPRYMAQDDPRWAVDDQTMEEESLAALERMYPAFRRDDVVSFQVARVREVLAVSTLEYSDRALPPVETSLPDVFVVNSAQIAHGTLNVNETVGLANAKAAELLGRFALAGAPAAVGTP